MRAGARKHLMQVVLVTLFAVAELHRGHDSLCFIFEVLSPIQEGSSWPGLHKHMFSFVNQIKTM